MSGFERSHSYRSMHSGSPVTADDLPKASVPNKTETELKLELLERRFTMPTISSPPNAAIAGSPSASTTLPSPNSHHQGNVNSRSQQEIGIYSTRGHNNNTNSNHSHHAFSFDNPSLSYQSLNHSYSNLGSHSQRSPNGSNGALGERDFSSNSGSRGDGSSKLDAVIAAATKHMKKVAAQNPGIDFNQPPTDDFMHSHSSNSTILTSHIQKKSINTVVQETPPDTNALLQKHKAEFDHTIETSKVNVEPQNMSVLPGLFNKNETGQMSKDKRKSVPVKRKTHSVRENTDLEDLEEAARIDRVTNMPSSVDRNNNKRKRLIFDPPTITPTTATMTNIDPTNNENINNNANSNVKSVSPAITRRRDTNVSPLHTRPSIGITNNNSNSPINLGGRSEHSRDNSRSAKPSTRTTKSMAPANNTTMFDYFEKTSKLKSSAGNSKNENKGYTNATKKPLPSSPKPKTKTRVSLDTVEAPLEIAEISKQLKQQLEEVEQWKQRCRELEQACQDKEEQLKAVANNRTILHSALKSALHQREEELTSLIKEKERYESSTRNVLEKLVRQDACQQAKELREKLAVDGARLGRIVYTRSGGMIGRSAHIETWEDGHATKELQAKKHELAAKRRTLERRKDAALREFERVQRKSNQQSTNNNKPENASDGADHNEDVLVDSVNQGEKVGGIEINTFLDAREAVESARFHLSNLKRKEHDLALEEQALNDDKANHIRALKRVASEDASRFRSRPKLHDRYVLQELLGKGGFSEVWRAYDLVELREVAVKIHQLDPRWPEAKKENYTKHVSREYEIHRNVRHPRIVSLYDVFEIDNNSFATVLECCNGTDLDTLLKAKRRLPERDARAILLQIISGMQYLSRPSPDGKRQGIIHYDLKPGNILFDEYGDAKITDFGLSKIVDTPDSNESMELTSQGAGTYWYLPPECFVTHDSVRISNKVDVWSIGVIFYQMVFGKRPFGDGQSQDKIMSDRTMLNAHEVTFPDKPEVTKECKQFIRQCLSYDQSFRPTISQIADHSYVVSKEL